NAKLLTRSESLKQRCLATKDEHVLYIYTCELAETLWKLATRSELYHVAAYLGLVPTLLHATSDFAHLACAEILSDGGYLQADTPMNRVAALTRYHLREILLQVIRQRRSELDQFIYAAPTSVPAGYADERPAAGPSPGGAEEREVQETDTDLAPALLSTEDSQYMLEPSLPGAAS
ncbi:hypothetical protein CMEL01_16815, partial [Colletotrichum melonis]